MIRPRPLPIFWQILLLLLGGLVVAQIVSVLLIVYLPPPRPDFYSMSEITGALRGDPDVAAGLGVTRRAAPPEPVADMVTQPALTARLAAGLGRPAEAVRLSFRADQSETFPFKRARGIGAVPIRHGQPYFFNTLEAAVRQPGGDWRVVRTPAPPLMSGWQQRTAIWFGLSALALLPVAWGFARALSRPIRRFAAAVERLDHDRTAPPVPVEGPAELRLTAVAVNDMRRNLHAYLRERTAMIGAIAHDLRTPLARVAFRVERAPEAVRGPIMSDIEQMRAMIASTIAFARDGAGIGERRPIALAALARAMVAQARETGSAVTAGPIRDGLAVVGDRSALERLIQNLLDNAVQYAGAATLTLTRDDGRAALTVLDDGPGIAKAELEHMFEPFARAEPSRSRATGGIGLGLAIARSIADAHGGTIVAANRLDGGLAVTVTLPLMG